MEITTINKVGKQRIRKVVAENGVSYSETSFSASDLVDILISKGILTEEDIHV